MARSVMERSVRSMAYLLKKAEGLARAGRQRNDQDLEPEFDDPPQSFVGLIFSVVYKRAEAYPGGGVGEEMVGHKFGEFSPTRLFLRTLRSQGEAFAGWSARATDGAGGTRRQVREAG